MRETSLHAKGRSRALLAAAAIAAACAGDAPVDPGVRAVPSAQLAAAEGGRSVDLGDCSKLQAPAGSTLAFHAYARGVQIYRWSGTSWVLVGPSATLFANADGRGRIGTHYAGPTWRSVSGGTVVGTVAERCPADPDAIPWLSLNAVADGPGVFHSTTFIQRLNTVGGKAPTEGGSFVGQETSVPYTAEYFFWRAP